MLTHRLALVCIYLGDTAYIRQGGYINTKYCSEPKPISEAQLFAVIDLALTGPGLYSWKWGGSGYGVVDRLLPRADPSK